MADIIDGDLAPSPDRAALTLLTVGVIAVVALGTWFLVAGVTRNPAASQVGDEHSAERNSRLDEPPPKFERKEVPTQPNPQQQMDTPRR